MVLGVETDTLDTDGKITKEIPIPNSQIPNLEKELGNILKKFTGEIEQTPPMYSAVHHEGRRLYELAREGREVERKPRKVVIYKIELRDTSIEPRNEPRLNGVRASIYVECSKGTYIRQLISDIGKKLGCGAHMSALQRTFSEPFDISQTHTLEEIEKIMRDGKIEELIIPVHEDTK
jgi:tRNA pseudouridine55 synthase